MNKLAELAGGKPSKILRLSADAMEEIPDDVNFKIKMSSFGGVRIHKGVIICVGCMATCAVQKLTGKRFTPSTVNLDQLLNDAAQFLGLTREALNKRLVMRFGLVMMRFEFRSEFLGVDEEDLRNFETAVDLARYADLELMFKICGLSDAWEDYKIAFAGSQTLDPQNDQRWEIRDDNYKESIPMLRAYADKLEAMGF